MIEPFKYIIDFSDFFLFWETIGVGKFIRFFWIFFIFEFPRYIIIDFIAIVGNKIKRFLNRKKYEIARKKLYLENPLISIIVPGKNEGKHIIKLVKSLKEQTYKNLEIIIIDDGSTDETSIIARNLLKKNKIDRYFRNNIRGGKASAANLGWNYSKGKYIIHVDADCSFDRDAIEKIIIPFYMDKKTGIVAGNLKVRNQEKGVLTSLQAIEYLKSIAIGRQATSFLGILRIVSGAYGAFRKDILKRIGGWDVGPGLDGDITVKTRKLGFKIYFEPLSIGYTSAPENIKKLIKQRTRWSRSLIRFRLRKHKDIFFPNENFSFLNFLSSLENVFFNLVLDLKWIVYILDILINFPHTAKYIIPANYILYLLSDSFQFLMILWSSERKKEEAKLLLYLPLMPLYMGIFIRAIRTWAYFKEFFFKSSYKDDWNPRKVSKKAEEIGV